MTPVAQTALKNVRTHLNQNLSYMKSKLKLPISAITIGCITFLFSCGTSNTSWQKDCGLFIQTLTDLAPKASKSGNGGAKYGDKFKNKTVEWDLTFKSISQSDKGEYQIDFDLEPFGIKYKFFSGKPVMMNHFKPATGTLEEWRNIKPDSKIKISAKVSDVFFVTSTPGDNPDMHVPVAVAIVEDTKIIEH